MSTAGTGPRQITDGRRWTDMRLGYKLMSEELGPRDLIANAVRAEEVGFELAAISDHYSPWLEEEGHAPFIWSVLSGIAVATEEIALMTAVTCPTFRYHPAVVAQAAATMSLIAGPRFRLGLGSGERLNEHVIGGGWPAPSVRQERFEEAIDVIRMLFEADGGDCSHCGVHFEIDRARLFDRRNVLPELATTRAFAAVSEGVTRDDLKQTPHGPDVERYVDAIGPYLEAAASTS